MEISFWKNLSTFRKTNDDRTRLGQKISSHGLYFRRLKNLHCLWIHHGGTRQRWSSTKKNESFLLMLNIKNPQYGLIRWKDILRQIVGTCEDLYYCTEAYCTLHTLEKCFSCLNILHTAQWNKFDRQAEVRHISANH